MKTNPASRQRLPRRSGRARDLLVRSLENRWKTFLLQWQKGQRRRTASAVHDLRVATRRLIATLELTMIVLPSAGVKDVRRSLKKLLKALNALRDVQVQIVAVRRLMPTYRVLRPFLASLLQEERRLIRRSSRSMARLNIGFVEQQVAEVSTSLLALFAEPVMDDAGLAAVMGCVAAAYTRTVNLKRQLNVNNPQSIHRLRVAFKKFRYMTEAAELISDRERKAMNAYQTRMGEVQDSEVLGANLRRFARRPVRTSALSFLPLHQYLARERQAAIESFTERVDELHEFGKACLGERTPGRKRR